MFRKMAELYDKYDKSEGVDFYIVLVPVLPHF